MGRCRFVQPDGNLLRIELSDGDFINVKKMLTWGEQQDAFGDVVKSAPLEGDAQLDPARVRIVKALTYLVSWSFCDANGLPQPINESTLRSLDADTGLEISIALVAHEQQMERRKVEKKRSRVVSPRRSGPRRLPTDGLDVAGSGSRARRYLRTTDGHVDRTDTVSHADHRKV